MNEIIGLDIGFDGTKTSEGFKCRSRISTQNKIIEDEDSIKIEMDNKKYYVGEGKKDVDLNRIDSELMRVCMAAAIGSSTKNKSVKIVTGLPISIYKTNREAFKNSFKDLNFTLNDVPREINIEAVEVFPQAAAIKFYIDELKKYNKKLYEDVDGLDTIIVDLGGKTVDICYFTDNSGKSKIESYSTRELGMLEVYKRLSQEVNNTYGLTLGPDRGERIFKDGFFFNPKTGEKKQIDTTKVLRSVSDDIYEELANYPIGEARVVLAGGGSYLFNQFISEKIKGVICLEKAEFSNAKGFKMVGQKIFGES